MKLLSAALAVAALAMPSVAAAAAYQDGATAYAANHVAQAETIWTQVAADPAAPARDRARANRELGRVAWLIDRDPDRAVRYLDAAVAVGEEVCDTARTYTRVLREAGRSIEAVALGVRLLSSCEVPAQAASVRLQAMRAELDVARAASGPDRAAALSDALRLWEGLDNDARGSLPANRYRLEYDLLAGDAADAFERWRTYFWLTEKDAPQGLAAYDGRVRGLFDRGLAAGSPATDRAALAELLIRAGFDQEARRWSEAADIADPAWRRARAYFRFQQGLDALTLKTNRALARGGPKRTGPFEKGFKTLARDLMTEAGLSGDQKTALAGAFGLYGTIGETSGYPSLHMGHIVQDEQRQVEQYGRSGEIRLISLEGMLSNGFESWLWDGTAATGGWAEGGARIIQVRQGYAAFPLQAWDMIREGPARRRAQAELPALEARDLSILKTTPVAFLPGLEARLMDQALAQIRARSTAAGGSEADQRRAFLEEFQRALLQHSIFLHEGRHILDQAAVAAHKEPKPDNFEYRAKLSELALADYPRLPLGAIDSENIGADNPHGKGNFAIMKAYGEWIVAHAAEVKGYDQAVPGPAQLDKLTDEQIRAVARSLDPWAQGSGR